MFFNQVTLFSAVSSAQFSSTDRNFSVISFNQTHCVLNSEHMDVVVLGSKFRK